MEGEVPRPIARGRVHEGYRSRSQRRGASHGQFPDVDPVLPRIGAHNPLVGGVGFHLVRVSIRPLMSADRETPRRRAGGPRRPNVIYIFHLKHRRPERPICQNWEHFKVAADVLGREKIPAELVHADVSRSANCG